MVLLDCYIPVYICYGSRGPKGQTRGHPNYCLPRVDSLAKACLNVDTRDILWCSQYRNISSLFSTYLQAPNGGLVNI